MSAYSYQPCMSLCHHHEGMLFISAFSPAPHRACDFHRTRRSIDEFSPTWGHHSGTHYKYHHRCDLCFSAPVWLLIVLRQPTSLLRMSNTFPRSDNPIRYHTPLGACYGTDDFFDSLSHASPYLAVSSTCITAWTVSLYFAGSSGSFRAMLTVGVLWTTGISVGCLSQPSADFTELRTVKLSLSTARRSLWWMFPSIGLSVLLQ